MQSRHIPPRATGYSATIVRSALVALFLAISVSLLPGCEGERVCPPERIADLPGTYIDEVIVQEASDWLAPSQSDGRFHVFNLAAAPLIADSTWSDLEITYVTPSTCDEYVWARNYETQMWDLASNPADPGAWCGAAVSDQFHLLSAVGLNPKRYLDSAFKMHLLTQRAGNPRVRVLRISPDYFAIAIPFWASGLAFGDHSLWVSSDWGSGHWRYNMIHNVALDGEILKEFRAPSVYANGLAFDGENLWLADGSDSIFKISQEGDVICRFAVPTEYTGGLTYGAGRLWLSEYEGLTPSKHIIGIDPAASCSAETALVTDVFKCPGGWSTGLAWTGSHLLAASDSLYEITVEGEVIRAYGLSVQGVEDITWDGDGVWVLSWGPKGCNGRDQVANRFKLR